MILFFGSMIRDLVTVTSKFPQPGETVIGSNYFTGFGGKTMNQCVASKFLGAQVAMVGKLGKDDNGQAYLENLKSLKIDTQFIEQVDQLPTGVASIFVNSETGENLIIVVIGANLAMSGDDVERANFFFKSSEFIVCTLEIPEPAIKAAFQKAKLMNVKTILNAAPANSKLDREILGLTDILCVNETEAEVLTGGLPIKTESEILAICVKLGKIVDTVIITLGAKGAAFLSKDMDKPELVLVNNEDVVVVDTTGAGDAFVGALAFFMDNLLELGLRKIIERSCVYATESVKRSGTQASFSKRSELPNYLFET